MAKSTSTYFGTGWVVSLILAIVFGWVMACIHRLMNGRILMAILALVLFPIFWWADVISLIVNKSVKWLM